MTVWNYITLEDGTVKEVRNYGSLRMMHESEMDILERMKLTERNLRTRFVKSDMFVFENIVICRNSLIKKTKNTDINNISVIFTEVKP